VGAGVGFKKRKEKGIRKKVNLSPIYRVLKYVLFLMEVEFPLFFHLSFPSLILHLFINLEYKNLPFEWEHG
jgi:hypothetical protein